MKPSPPIDGFWKRTLSMCGQASSLSWVLALAGLLRLGSVLLLRNYIHPVTWEFGPIAENIRSGLGYSIVLSNGLRVPSAFEPPAYPFFLALFFWMGGERPFTFLMIELFQAALGVLLVFIIYRIAFILLGAREALVAASLTAIYPALIYTCNEFHGISTYIVLEALIVFFLTQYLEASRSWKDVFAAALCMGLMMLYRGEGPGLLLVYAAVLVLRSGRKGLKPALFFLIITIACLAPWTIRNYRAFGRIVPVCTGGGASLWIGNNPLASGGDRYSVPPDLGKAFDSLPLDRAFEVSKDDALTRLALTYIRTHPFRDAELAIKKLFLFSVFDPYHKKGRRLIYWLPSALLTILALCGAARRGKRLFRDDLLLSASVLFAITVGMVFLVLPRYRIVIDPFLIIIASAAIVQENREPQKTPDQLSFRHLVRNVIRPVSPSSVAVRSSEAAYR